MTFEEKKAELVALIQTAPAGVKRDAALAALEKATAMPDLITIATGLLTDTEAVIKAIKDVGPIGIVKEIPEGADITTLFPALRAEMDADPKLKALYETMEHSGMAPITDLAKQLLVGLEVMTSDTGSSTATKLILQASAALATANFLSNLAAHHAPQKTVTGQDGRKLSGEIIGMLATKVSIAMAAEMAEIRARVRNGESVKSIIDDAAKPKPQGTVLKDETKGMDPDLAAAIFGAGHKGPATC
jgi:hypothetical protein